MKKAVVFDFGGVLFRWEPMQLMQQVMPELARSEAEARALVNRIYAPDGDWAQFDLGRISEAALADRIAAITGCRAEQAMTLIDAVPAHLSPRAETVALLRELQAAGHRMYYLSNMPAPYADYLETTHDFVRSFDRGIFSARVGLMKPDEAIFRLASEHFALGGAPTVFIDDHRGNIEAAQAFGWQAVRFADAHSCRSELRALSWL